MINGNMSKDAVISDSYATLKLLLLPVHFLNCIQQKENPIHCHRYDIYYISQIVIEKSKPFMPVSFFTSLLEINVIHSKIN